MALVPGSPRRDLTRIAVGLVGLGALLRIIKFLQQPSLWLDEAMIALNVGRRSYAQLMEPLDYAQLAPVPWLWLEKLAVELGGMHELALRAPALLAGVALSWLVWRAGLHLVGEWGALVATALTATAATLLFYAVETKPYGLDAMITALLLGMGGRCLTRPLGDRSMHGLGLVGVVALLSSFPAIFVLGGLGIASLVRATWARNSRAATATVAWGIVWVAVFALPQVWLYRHVGQAEVMQRYWLPTMARLDAPGVLDRASTAANALVGALIGWEVWPGTELYLLVLAFGAWTIARKRGVATMLAVTCPLALLALAWLLNQIPAAPRLFLFAAPILALLYGAAVAQVLHNVPIRFRPVGTAIVAVLLSGLLFAEGYAGLTRPKASGGRQLVHQIVQSPPAPVWLTRASAPVWVYYTTDWHAPDTRRLDWFAARASTLVDPRVGSSSVAEQDRVSAFGGSVERVAWPSGLTSGVGEVRQAADLEQWARNEIRQVALLPGARPFMLMLHEREAEHAALQLALDEAGLTAISVDSEKRGRLWQISRADDQAPRTVSNSSMDPQR